MGGKYTMHQNHHTLRRRTLRVSGSLLKYLAVLAIFLFLLFPVYWMLITSLKENMESVLKMIFSSNSVRNFQTVTYSSLKT